MLPLLLVLLLPVHGLAQESGRGGGWGALRISKWTALAATVGAAVYGVSTIQAADRGYEGLESACQVSPQLCKLRQTDGSYSDADFEQRYQTVLRQDRRARTALLASQLGVAATVTLFLLDLRHARGPKDIPYHPPQALELRPRPDGVELRLHLPAR